MDFDDEVDLNIRDKGSRKKSFFVVGPLRGGWVGPLGRTTKKKLLFFKVESKNPRKNVTTKLEVK